MLFENDYLSFPNTIWERVTLGETFINANVIELTGYYLIGVEDTETRKAFYSILPDGTRDYSFPEVIFINFKTNRGILQ